MNDIATGDPAHVVHNGALFTTALRRDGTAWHIAVWAWANGPTQARGVKDEKCSNSTTSSTSC